MRTATDIDLAMELAQALDPRVDPEAVRQAFAVHGGNLREVWFALYDLYEQRRMQRLEREPPEAGA